MGMGSSGESSLQRAGTNVNSSGVPIDRCACFHPPAPPVLASTGTDSPKKGAAGVLIRLNTRAAAAAAHWACLAHICTKTWACPCHICIGTGLTAPTSALEICGRLVFLLAKRCGSARLGQASLELGLPVSGMGCLGCCV